ncbi:hypothetical protein [Jiella sonneratiae]|uniref:Uncharacterized protein n=1 Tax=Jiella sonneratiae TaxID=2816856 RepID=A0ABS3J8N1_9HYPH|nr:hypothetical protein [Jiella sonneratiae]MBO0905467.1 hypothetical protein [Jiella sonneratiae]
MTAQHPTKGRRPTPLRLLRARRLAGFAGLAGFVALALPGPVRAQTDINAILGGETPAAGETAGTPGIRPQPFPGTVDQGTAPQTGRAATEVPVAKGGEERWVNSDHPVENLSVISVHPLPGEKCQDVLFDIRPSTRVRHTAAVGGTLDFDLGQLCLLGIRNESDRRTVVVRVGEELKTVAIVSDSRLNSGIALGPGREIMTPIRPLDVKALSIGVEAVWDDQIDSPNPTVESFALRLVRKDKPGS